MTSTPHPTIAAQPEKNSQVSPEVKAHLQQYLCDRGVVRTDQILITQYQRGDWVCLSVKGSVRDINAVNKAFFEMVKDYWRNRYTSDDSIWAHREWIEKEFY